MKPMDKVDAELMKQVPLLTPHKKEVASYCIRGSIITSIGFLAYLTSGFGSWLLWASFAFMLFQLGGDFNKLLQRQDEPPLTILKP